MSVASIKAGKAFYEIFAKDKTSEGLSSAEAGLKRFGAKITMIGASMAGFSAAALTGLTAMIKGFAGAGDEISDAMNVTGLSNDFLQTLQFGAADAGVNLNALVGGLTKFNSTLAKAAAGNKAATKSFAQLGLNAQDLLSLHPDERFKAVADAIAKIPDPAQRAAAAVAMFGKTGAKLLPAMEGGLSALNEQMADLKSRGLIMSDEDRQMAASAEGAFLSLSLVLARIQQLIAAAVTPAFLQVMSVIQSVAESVATFIDNNRELVAWIATGIGVIGALGVALMAIGGVAIFLGSAISAITAAFSAVGTVVAAILSPVGLIVIAITACGAAALTAAYYLDQLFNGGAALKALYDAAMVVATGFQLLWKAVSSGRWDLAGQLIKTGLLTGFYAAILSIKEAWNNLTIWMVEKLTNRLKEIEANLPEFLHFSSNMQQVLAGMKQRGNEKLADDRDRLATTYNELQKTIAEINKAGEVTKAKRAVQVHGVQQAVVNQVEKAVLSSAAGTATSAGALNIGRTGGVNSVDEQQLNATLQGNGLLEDIKDGIEELEGLTVE